MNRLEILVCENYLPDIRDSVEKAGFTDVIVSSYPCRCSRRGPPGPPLRIRGNKENDAILLCGRDCGILREIRSENRFYKTYTSEYCFSHIADRSLLEYIVRKGGYIISSGWLRDWRRRLADCGFDRATASRFYNDFASELVYVDTNVHSDSEKDLKELSEYLTMPATSISISGDSLVNLMKSAVYAWRLDGLHDLK